MKKLMMILCVLGFMSCASQDDDKIQESQEFVVEGTTLVKYNPQSTEPLRVVLPESITTINKGVFQGLNVLTIDGASVVNIQDDAFKDCHNLTTIRFSRVKYIGEHAFMNCTALKFYFTQVVPIIEWETFKGTSQDKFLVLPRSLWADALNIEDAGFELKENNLPALESSVHSPSVIEEGLIVD